MYSRITSRPISTHRGSTVASMELGVHGRTTIHTRLSVDEKVRALLDRYAERFGRDLRRLNAMLDQGVRLSAAKRQFIREGLTGRQFNGIACTLEGMRASREKCYAREIKLKRHRVRTLLKKLALPRSQGGYPPRMAHQKRRVLARLRQFLSDAPKRKPSIVFGGKKLWKAQHHLKENAYASHGEWRNSWSETRSGEFFFVGSKGESGGNQSCQYEPWLKRLTIRLPDEMGGWLEIPNVSFPYRPEILKRALAEKNAISYRFVRGKKGWTLRASTRVKAEPTRTNPARGMLGIDVGPDRIAGVETDPIGNPIVRKTFRLPLYRKTRDQARALIGEVAAQIVDWADRSGKPVVLEDLDFEEKKAELKERGKMYARMLSSFAYQVIGGAIQGRCA